MLIAEQLAELFTNVEDSALARALQSFTTNMTNALYEGEISLEVVEPVLEGLQSLGLEDFSEANMQLEQQYKEQCNDNIKENCLWQLLSTKEMNTRSITLLSHCMLEYCKEDHTARVFGVIEFYIRVLCIPGQSSVFQPSIFRQCVSTLRMMSENFKLYAAGGNPSGNKKKKEVIENDDDDHQEHLFDSREQLVHQWLLQTNVYLQVGNVLDAMHCCLHCSIDMEELVQVGKTKKKLSIGTKHYTSFQKHVELLSHCIETQFEVCMQPCVEYPHGMGTKDRALCDKIGSKAERVIRDLVDIHVHGSGAYGVSVLFKCLFNVQSQKGVLLPSGKLPRVITLRLEKALEFIRLVHTLSPIDEKRIHQLLANHKQNVEVLSSDEEEEEVVAGMLTLKLIKRELQTLSLPLDDLDYKMRKSEWESEIKMADGLQHDLHKHKGDEQETEEDQVSRRNRVEQEFQQLSRRKRIAQKYLELMQNREELLGPTVHEAAGNLLKHLSLTAQARVSVRDQTTKTIIQLAHQFPLCVKGQIHFVAKLSGVNKTVARLGAVEISFGLISAVSVDAEEAPPSIVENIELLQLTIISRTHDKAAGVRAKALTSLGNCIALCSLSGNTALRQEFFRIIAGFEGDGAGKTKIGSPVKFRHYILTKIATPSKEISAQEQFHADKAGMKALFTLLRLRAQDPRAAVRRSILKTLESLLLGSYTADEDEEDSVHVGDHTSVHTNMLHQVDHRDMAILFDACRDEAALIRKQAVQCLDRLFTAFPDDRRVCDMWIGGVLPLLTDVETSVQTAAVDIFLRNYIAGMKQYISRQTSFLLLQALEEADESTKHYFQRGIGSILKRVDDTEHITNLISLCNNGVATCTLRGFYIILEQVSLTYPYLLSPSIILHTQIKYNQTSISTEYTRDKANTQLQKQGILLPERKLKIDKLLKGIFCNFSIDEQNNMIRTSLLKVMTNVVLQNSIGTKLTICKQGYGCKPNTDYSEYVVNGLYTQECLLQLLHQLEASCYALTKTQPILFSFVHSKIVLMQALHSVLENSLFFWTNPLLQFHTYQLQTHSESSHEYINILVAALFMAGDQILETTATPYTELTTATQQLLSPHITYIDDTNGTTQRATPSNIRAHAFTTFGKFMLKDLVLCKKYTPLLISELTLPFEKQSQQPTSPWSDKKLVIDANEGTTHAMYRSNIFLILTDICRVHTNVVDTHLNELTMVLMDPNVMLRKNAIVSIIQQQLEDFQKWKSSLYLRLLRLTADDDVQIRTLVQANLATAVQHTYSHTKQHKPEQFFVDQLFFLNQCTVHPMYNQVHEYNVENMDDEMLAQTRASSLAQIVPQDSRVLEFNGFFALTGEKNKLKRMHIYKYSLRQLSDDQKLKVYNQLINAILGGIINGDLPIVHQDKTKEEEKFISINNDQLSNRVVALLTLRRQAKKSLEMLSNGHTLHSMHTELRVLTNEEQMSTMDVIIDTLDLLALPEMRLQSSEKNNEGDKDIDAMQAVFSAKQKIQSKIHLKNVVENVLPQAMEVKRVLEKSKHPLTSRIMLFLRDLVLENKSEIDEVLAGDNLLKEELLYDIEKYEEYQNELVQQKKRKEREELMKQVSEATNGHLLPNLPKPLVNNITSDHINSTKNNEHSQQYEEEEEEQPKPVKKRKILVKKEEDYSTEDDE